MNSSLQAVMIIRIILRILKPDIHSNKILCCQQASYNARKKRKNLYYGYLINPSSNYNGYLQVALKILLEIHVSLPLTFLAVKFKLLYPGEFLSCAQSLAC